MLVEVCKDLCHAKVSIGGIDDIAFEERAQAESRRQLLAMLLWMPIFADQS
jgi:hypothetical protein